MTGKVPDLTRAESLIVGPAVWADDAVVPRTRKETVRIRRLENSSARVEAVEALQ